MRSGGHASRSRCPRFWVSAERGWCCAPTQSMSPCRCGAGHEGDGMAWCVQAAPGLDHRRRSCLDPRSRLLTSAALPRSGPRGARLTGTDCTEAAIEPATVHFTSPLLCLCGTAPAAGPRIAPEMRVNRIEARKALQQSGNAPPPSLRHRRRAQRVRPQRGHLSGRSLGRVRRLRPGPAVEDAHHPSIT